MEFIGTVYTLQAVANRIGKTKGTLRQMIKRLNEKGEPLEFGDFRLIMIHGLGYIGVLKNEEIVIIEE